MFPESSLAFADWAAYSVLRSGISKEVTFVLASFYLRFRNTKVLQLPARLMGGGITGEYSFGPRFVQTLFFPSGAAKRSLWRRNVLGSIFALRPKGACLSFPSDSILSWPLTRPVDAGSRTSVSSQSVSPEIEVVELFEELRDRLLRYLLALGLSAHDGEEIIQESFLLLFQHLRSGKPRQNLRGWVFRVARNLALKQRGANQLALRRVVEFDQTFTERCADQNPNPEEHLGHRQRQQRLLSVVSALPEVDRSCLSMRAEGLRYREIATALGISLGSVAASLARSLAKLGRADGG